MRNLTRTIYCILKNTNQLSLVRSTGDFDSLNARGFDE